MYYCDMINNCITRMNYVSILLLTSTAVKVLDIIFTNINFDVFYLSLICFVMHDLCHINVLLLMSLTTTSVVLSPLTISLLHVLSVDSSTFHTRLGAQETRITWLWASPAGECVRVRVLSTFCCQRLFNAARCHHHEVSVARCYWGGWMVATVTWWIKNSGI